MKTKFTNFLSYVMIFFPFIIVLVSVGFVIAGINTPLSEGRTDTICFGFLVMFSSLPVFFLLDSL